MTTCEQCGANALDARGICGNCGWQAPDGDIALGETREADVAASVARGHEPHVSGAPRFERTTQMPPYAPPRPTTGRPVSGMGTGNVGATSRYCGTCGARITGNEAFCGQCGTPIGGANDFGTSLDVRSSDAGRYGGSGAWTPGEGDALTEPFVVSPVGGYPRTPANNPYAQMGYGGSGAMNGQASADSSRGIKTLFGVLCLVASVASAVGAVFLAVHR